MRTYRLTVTKPGGGRRVEVTTKSARTEMNYLGMLFAGRNMNAAFFACKKKLLD